MESLDPDTDRQFLLTFTHSRMVAALWLVISRDSIMSVDAVTALMFVHLHKSWLHNKEKGTKWVDLDETEFKKLLT